MSSYLSFYVVPKRKSEKEHKQHLILASFSRSSDIYQYFDENLHPIWAGNDEKYTTLTKDNVSDVLRSFNEDIHSYQTRLGEYEKYASENPEYIEEIIQMKEEIANLEYWRGMTAFIEEMVDNVDFYKEIEEVCCNIT